MFWKRKKSEETLTVADLMEYGREEAARLVAIERAQYELQKEQKRQAAQIEKLATVQTRQEKEQQKQAEQLAKHERRIADLEFRMEQAETDILHWSETVNSLYALLDVELSTQAGAMPGSKTDVRCQKRIITLNNQIHAAEARVNRAKHTKQMASMELAQ